MFCLCRFWTQGFSLLSSVFVLLFPFLSFIFSLSCTPLHPTSFTSPRFSAPSPPPLRFLLFFLFFLSISLFSSHSISSSSSSPIIPSIILFLLLSLWYPDPHKALSLSERNIFMCLSSAPHFLRLVSLHVKVK